MKGERSKKLRLVLGWALFFLVIAMTVNVAVNIYSVISELDFNDYEIAGIMFAVIVALSALCTAIDAIRRRIMVDRPVAEILAATKRIAEGDFSVRLEPNHKYGGWDDLDSIKDDLNVMAEALKASETLSNDFVSNVSHEIKTPIQIIISSISALKNEDMDTETRQKYVDTALQAAKRLNALAVNTLKLNKLETNKLRPQPESVALDTMLEETLLTYADALDKKDIEVESDLERVKMTSSPAHLEIIFNNLVSNAVKFTLEGGRISIKLRRTERGARVTIADTGVGIDPAAGKRIFDKYYQGDTSHKAEGNGLGLALVKRAIDAIGGEIAVESEPGKGSTFTVTVYDGNR